MKIPNHLLTLAALAQWLQPSVAEDYPFTAEQKHNANRTLSIGYVGDSVPRPVFSPNLAQVVYHGYTILDVFGPLQFIADVRPHTQKPPARPVF